MADEASKDLREKAAAAVVALANRSAGKGRTGSGNPAKLREAVAFYDIAIGIHPEAFWIYTKGLLLEELGDFAGAQAVLLSLGGTAYDKFGQQGAARCQQKAAGTYDESSIFGELQAMVGNVDLGDLAKQFKDLQAYMGSGQAEAAKGGQGAGDAGDAEDDEAREAAGDFVDLLLAKGYAGARKMLHSSLKLSANDLQEAFEALFEDEPFPESAQVFSSEADWPAKQPGDLAWLYVTIDSENGEAVTVTVSREKGRLTIREIEWGRP